MLNINNLHNEILEREAKKELIYEDVYKKVVDKIKYTNKKSSDCFLIYSCPNYIYGVPRYSIEPCIAYIMKKLIDHYFRVNFYAPNILFISWQHLPPKTSYLELPGNIQQHTLLEYKDHKQDIVNKKSKQYMFNEIDKEFLLNSSAYKGNLDRTKEQKRIMSEPINYNNNNPKNYNNTIPTTTTTNNNIKTLSINPNYINKHNTNNNTNYNTNLNNYTKSVKPNYNTNLNNKSLNNKSLDNKSLNNQSLDNILSSIDDDFSGTLL